MSWDASISYGGHTIRDWNYTHNCNAMIERVLDVLCVDHGQDDPPFWVKMAETSGAHGHMGRGSWWRVLHGMNGEDGYKFLSSIVGGLSEAPAMFREMNPENGWGDYDSLIRVLAEMRDTSRDCPEASWWCGG